MVKRKKIGLVFSFDNKTNSGIVNYLFSLIKALNTLADERKPELIIFYSNGSPIEMIKNENYPFISFHTNVNAWPNDFFSGIVNRVSRKLLKKNLIVKNRLNLKQVDYLFPYSYANYKEIKGKVQWLVDFNPYYFPDHLSQEERKSYFDYVKSTVYSDYKVVLSSYDIWNDLKKFHPDYTCKVEILRFAALLPAFDHLSPDDVKAKFDITRPYVMTPNQFWVHKNHITMLKAALLLKQRGVTFQMVFTGSTKVESESNYYPSLLQFINDNDLKEEVKILGIVDRAEQLTLMKASEALVQPSLFEGWSTLVEESKALNKAIVVSDLPIHREQIDFNCVFFDPHNEVQLADILQEIFASGFDVKPHDYNEDINRYAERILEIFN